MTTHDILEIARLVAVLSLVIFAAALATPKGRLPLALRGLMKIMHRDAGTVPAAPSLQGTGNSVPSWKKTLSFLLIIAAAVLALVNL